MKSGNNQDPNQINLQQVGYPVVYQNDNEIDLIELFLSLCCQWKLLATITLIGTLITVIYALRIPHQYEVSVQIAPPVAADIKALNIRGYETYNSEQIFTQYLDQLRSVEHLQFYLKHENWYKVFFPDVQQEIDEKQFISGFYGKVQISEKESLVTKKTEYFEHSVPKLVGLSITGVIEENLVDFANEYIKFTNNYLLRQIEEKGKYSVGLEIEKIEQTIKRIRTDAKVKRELLITKLEEQNQETMARLEDEKKLLLAKSELDKQSKIAQLKEAFSIAKQVGIKKLTTIDSLATENNKAKTIVSLSGNGSGNKIYALMGTDYLKSELETLEKRTNSALFIPEISKIIKQIDDIRHDERILALKARKSDDPYITDLPVYLTKIDQLKQLSFDFSKVQLYRLDKGAYGDGVPEKPNRSLMVTVGAMISGMISLFVALIVNGFNKHKELEVETS